MPDVTPPTLDEQVLAWREAMLDRPGVAASEVDELEGRLRGQLDALGSLGLSDDEVFLVAAHRVGRPTPVVSVPAPEARGWVGVGLMLVFALLAGLAVRLPMAALADGAGPDGGVAPVVVALVSLSAVLAAYLAWRRRPPSWVVLAAMAVLLGVIAAALIGYPFVDPRETQQLGLLHAPIAIAVALGAVYAGRGWRDLGRWMDYLRFLGEVAIYYVLIAMGGGVLLGLASGVLALGGLRPDFLFEWVLPLGVGGAVVVAAWLVEAKRAVAENMAPVLATVFTPLFILLLVVFLAVLGIGGVPAEATRWLLILVDLVLVIVLALHVFSVSARRPDAPVGWLDRFQFVLLVTAVAVDVWVLIAMAGRILEWGASPNKVAALGENVVLLVNLGVAAWLMFGFLGGRRPFADVERWQSRYLPVIGVWALAVVLVLPVVFGFR